MIDEMDGIEAEIIKPISDATVTGIDVREDNTWADEYYKLRDLRQKLRRNERYSSIDEQQNEIEQWREILQHTINMLQNATKDIEISTWLVEALTRVYGIEGLAAGLNIVKQLITNFNDQLFPSSDPDEGDLRYAPLQVLAGGYSQGTLIQPINLAPIIETQDGCVSYWDYNQAQAFRKFSEHEKQEFIKAGKLTFENLVNLISLQEIDALKAKIDCIQNCITLCNDIETVVQSYESNAISLKNLRDALQNCAATANYFDLQIRKKLALKEQSQQEEAAITDHDGELDKRANYNCQTTPDNLQTALNHIQLALEYFKSQQPHSPVASLLKRAFDWSSRELHELLPELIPDQQARQLYCLITGTESSQIDEHFDNQYQQPVDDDSQYESMQEEEPY